MKGKIMETNWDLTSKVLNADFSIEDLVNSIYLFERLKFKYPNDETIQTAIEILREEVCQMFGGTIYVEE